MKNGLKKIDFETYREGVWLADAVAYREGVWRTDAVCARNLTHHFSAKYFATFKYNFYG